MRSYFLLIFHCPRLLVAEFFRFFVAVLPLALLLGAFVLLHQATERSSLIIGLCVAVILLAIGARGLTQAIWVSLYAWAFRLDQGATISWRLALWDAGAALKRPLLLVARLSGESDPAKLLALYHDALVRVFGVSTVAPKTLGAARIVFFVLPVFPGFVLMVLGAAQAQGNGAWMVGVGFALILLSILALFLHMAAFELTRLRLVQIVVDPNLSVEQAREKALAIGLRIETLTLVEEP
jgi:hypothetical protein